MDEKMTRLFHTEIQGDTAVIIEYTGRESRVEIPGTLKGKPVTAIAKKVFLGNKALTEVILPETLTEVGDWAFAHCSNLRRVEVKGKTLSFGRGVFKDCGKLETIDTGQGEELARLLAAAPTLLDAEYLLDVQGAGSEEWLDKWDSRMRTLLIQPDDEGFTKLVLCGEEDLLADLPEYMARRRRFKAGLCFLRLLHPKDLQVDNRLFLEEYLKNHAKGCADEAAWEALLQDYATTLPAYEIFAKAGGITAENLPGMFGDLGEGNAEIKAFLMKYQKENLEKRDFFDSLSLD